ncbi:hypothetical protein EK21DRAFT_85658 [Setomelanomma holmii]|uniref:Uncharacterized protein n=1 Tax=Setomelanomma holmii TaxID=210430 RepID=A0A9P4LQG4_9PLEO|nr:hypothetical protein EK21DRAFT_85658 [Setomelanomma holmii]
MSTPPYQYVGNRLPWASGRFPTPRADSACAPNKTDGPSASTSYFQGGASVTVCDSIGRAVSDNMPEDGVDIDGNEFDEDPSLDNLHPDAQLETQDKDDAPTTEIAQ